MVDMKGPVPAPSLVLVVWSTVGLAVMLHTTPRAVTVADPCWLINPPVVVPPEVMALTCVVVTVGKAVPGSESFLQEKNNKGETNSSRSLVFITLRFCGTKMQCFHVAGYH